MSTINRLISPLWKNVHLASHPKNGRLVLYSVAYTTTYHPTACLSRFPTGLVLLSVGRSLHTRTGATEGSAARPSRWRSLLRPLRWVRIPLGFGILYIAYQSYLRVRGWDQAGLSPGYTLARNWEVTCYRMLPLKTMSRAWGWINSIDLPYWARKPVLGMYVRSFGCDLAEAEIEDLTYYRNLGEFFRRPIKESTRPIDKSNCVVSPADGTVLAFGAVDKSQLEQVKGVTYSLDRFFGPTCWTGRNNCSMDSDNYQKNLLSGNSNHELYQCVIYLAPGDYHRFHSPVDWEVTFRRHFAGDLMSVSPGMARWIPELFTLNERAVYIGKWKYGFFSMSPVGATNVGSISVAFDEELQTNIKRKRKGTRHDCSFLDQTGRGVRVAKGELFGEFNLGSTIVLVFEAPKDFQFTISEGSKVKFGQSLNHCIEEKTCAVHGDERWWREVEKQHAHNEATS